MKTAVRSSPTTWARAAARGRDGAGRGRHAAATRGGHAVAGLAGAEGRGGGRARCTRPGDGTPACPRLACDRERRRPRAHPRSRARVVASRDRERLAGAAGSGGDRARQLRTAEDEWPVASSSFRRRASQDRLRTTVTASSSARSRALRRSTKDDAGFFCGRERLIAEMVARLAGAPLMGIVGPSGSGKSSALRAGLLPALVDGCCPEANAGAASCSGPASIPMRSLERGTGGGAGSGCVIAVDQFEEVFTACRGRGRTHGVRRRAGGRGS